MSKDLSIHLRFAITTCRKHKLYLPNGVGILSNGNVVVAEGGNDMVHVFNAHGVCLRSIGRKGLGKYLFKEPVGVFVSDKDEVFVADWHNHRVVIYDENLSYLDEFGHFGYFVPNKRLFGIGKRILRFLKMAGYVGSYAPNHFLGPDRKSSFHFFNPYLCLQSILYWRTLPSYKSLFFLISDTKYAMNKPNGIAFHKSYIVVSQKNAKCLSVYERQPPYSLLANHYGPEKRIPFGRLGNIVFDRANHLYVCDERNNVVWILNSDFKLTGRISSADVKGLEKDLLPFSCSMLDEELLCICGGFKFHVIHLPKMELRFSSERIGELHSVTADIVRRRLYLANRSDGLIMVYSY